MNVNAKPVQLSLQVPEDDNDIEGPTRSQWSCLWDQEQVNGVLAADETQYMCISIAGVVHMQDSIFTRKPQRQMMLLGGETVQARNRTLIGSTCVGV